MGITNFYNKMGKDTGTVSFIDKQESIKKIELLTERFKKGRISTDDYILQVNQSLQKLSSKRDYIKYLMNIGQFNN
jgi:uncharacterized membrane protein